jgi:14-3-3 protein epsilon
MMEQALLCFRSGLVDEGVSYVNKISQQLPESDLITAVSIFKKALNARRSAWRMCAKECVKYVSVGNERLARLSGHQRDIIEGELLQLITEAATFVRHQKNQGNSITAQIELLKMNADLSRYLIEVYGHKPAVFRALTADTVHQATIAYEEANELVLKSELDPSGPVALGLSLNFSVFTYEVLHKPREACKIAKRALDAVALNLGPLAVSGEAKDVDKRILTLVQYLRNNLVLWTSQPA